MHVNGPDTIFWQKNIHLLVRPSRSAAGDLVSIRIIDKDIQIRIRLGRFRRQGKAEEGHTREIELMCVAEAIIGVEGLIGILHHGRVGDCGRDQAMRSSRIGTGIAELHVEAGRTRFAAAGDFRWGIKERALDCDGAHHRIFAGFPFQRALAPFANRAAAIIGNGHFERSRLTRSESK